MSHSLLVVRMVNVIIDVGVVIGVYFFRFNTRDKNKIKNNKNIKPTVLVSFFTYKYNLFTEVILLLEYKY